MAKNTESFEIYVYCLLGLDTARDGGHEEGLLLAMDECWTGMTGYERGLADSVSAVVGYQRKFSETGRVRKHTPLRP